LAAAASIFGWVFYGYDLGLFGKLGVTAALGTGVAIYIPHVIFSNCWLRQFRFGPIEWLWRTAMYGDAAARSRQKSLDKTDDAGVELDPPADLKSG